MSTIKIGPHAIGLDAPPLIVAELSGNHNRSLETACKILQAAAQAGAKAVKLQTYRPESITIDQRGGNFEISDPKSLWHGRSLFELYAEASTPYEWHPTLFEEAARLGMVCFSTPFDLEGVEMLERLGAPAYKIASFENNHFPLLKAVARTGKPLLMSTGASQLAEITQAVDYLRSHGQIDLILLKCTSNYPATPENSHLRTIPHMRQLFDCEVGLSDHTIGVGVPVAAVALGATVIEKHVCLSRDLGGVDSAFSLEPAELRSLVVETERAWQALGRVHYQVLPSEESSRMFKRSIYLIEDVDANQPLEHHHLGIIRPGDGLHPRHLEELIGLRPRNALKKGSPLNWGLF